eukprot:g16246.t1
MLRCKDPAASIKYYEERYGMKLVDVYHAPTIGKSNYFLASLRDGEGETWPTAGTTEAHRRLFDMQHACLQLEHEHGSENDPYLVYSNGNDEPHRGFGHLAFLTADVYQASEELERAGVSFKKKPDEGRMKGLAFAYDPSGYWVELVKRNKEVCELHFDGFSLYFLQSLPSEEMARLPASDSPEAYSRMGQSWEPVLELTHNHGTESDPTFSYHDGNTDPKGFGFLGFIADDLDGAARCLNERGVPEIPEPAVFKGKLRRFRDPDGYHVQLALRGAVLE